jgi:hypothetical protein
MYILFRKNPGFVIMDKECEVTTMISTEIGLDLNNLEYAIIKKKNQILPLVLIIIGFSFLLVAIPFLVIWLLQVPVEINGVNRYPYEQIYINFMVTFNAIFTSLTISILLAAFILNKKEPMDFLIINKDFDYNTYYEIVLKKNKSIFFTQKKAFYYNYLSNELEEISAKEEILYLIDKYIFWKKWKNVESYKVVKKNKKTILKFSYKNRRIVLNYRYALFYQGNTIPYLIKESVGNNQNSRNSTNVMNSYYLTNLNRNISRKLPEKIMKVINNNY